MRGRDAKRRTLSVFSRTRWCRTLAEFSRRRRISLGALSLVYQSVRCSSRLLAWAVISFVKPVCTISLKMKLRRDIRWLDKKIMARCPPSDFGWSKIGGESADIHPSGCHLESRQRVEAGGWGAGGAKNHEKSPQKSPKHQTFFFPLKSIYIVPRCL